MSSYSNTQSRLQRIAPQLRPAGVHGDFSEATVAELLSSFNPDGLVTPDHIRAFQHRGAGVGEATRSWSRSKDSPVDPNMRHGVKGETASGGAEACLRPEEYADKMTALLDAQRETQYLSNRRKPLGHAPVPENPVPVPLHGFGITHEKGESTQSVLAGYRAVDVIHPAGEQVSRNYNWDAHGIDPTQHRFGRPSENSNGSTAAAVRCESATQLRSKLANDYQSTVAHELGKSKSYGFDDPAEWDATKRGRVAQPGASGKAASHFQTEQPTVQEVLSSWAAATSSATAAQSADEASVSDGEKTCAVEQSSAQPSKNKLGNLEDDVRAHQLLYPCHYVSLGVESKYFAGGRTLDDIRQLCHKCDFGLTDADIDAVFNEMSKDGKCSIEEFKNQARVKGLM
ncbi:hypothetical protein ABB37_03722 [Leptomonas pyrrhocoris]|uniref:EFHB C-terminal EF-hand domain-containing protein n=1 Tax=Leptomonas pyrrhocoris TaxID=157538 RepID=A0A0M9G307_LEPPY|nr:hypothetical protein ABB37_03722 [Leptomonas pyrrhocoris]KPA81325.1 hypothetical protein ABB37_03722 [Leptomonas pyrrhocoris]|eukprot:XP_015659764.1 hypothetical protein ABB37_03722 [Leptomonas pyrrhocoris]